MTRRPVGENRRVTRDQPSREPYLVRHDCGMGALWWWTTAASAAEITTTFAEVEVIDDPTTVRAVESWSLDELDIADAISGPLAELYSQREQQCQDPAFGQLLGKSRVYFRLAEADVDPGRRLSDHRPHARRGRQTELRPAGTGTAS